MSVTTIIIILNVIASMYAWRNRDVYYRWMMNPYQVYHQKQYFRFFTSGFIHVDTMHLLFNMLTLYFFGEYVENDFARIAGSNSTMLFIVFYLLAIIVSEIPTFF